MVVEVSPRAIPVWRLTGTTVDGVNDTPSSQDLRIRCDEVTSDVIFSSGRGKPRYQSEPDHTSTYLQRTRVARFVWRGTCFQIAQVLRGLRLAHWIDW